MDIRILNDKQLFTKPMEFYKEHIIDICDRICTACEICAASGRPADRMKLSTTHINAEFYEELQVDCPYTVIHGNNQEVIKMMDTGT